MNYDIHVYWRNNDERNEVLALQKVLIENNIQTFPSSFWQIDDVTRKNFAGKNDQVRDDARTTSINGNLRFNWKILDNVTFVSSLSYNLGFVRRDYLRHRSVVANNRTDAILAESNSSRYEIENYATWSKSFGTNLDHNLSVLIGQGAEEQIVKSTNATGNGIPFDAIKIQFGLNEQGVRNLMRKELKASSYRRWRERVESCKTKHNKTRVEQIDRFKSSSQRVISNNKISKR